MSNHIDMMYEYLLRAAFDCKRYEDPYGLANADVLRHATDGDNDRLIRGITVALDKVTNDHHATEPELAEELVELAENLANDPSNANAYEVIRAATEIFKTLGVTC